MNEDAIRGADAPDPLLTVISLGYMDIKVKSLTQSIRPQFVWMSPPGCPIDLPLFLLQEGDAWRLAAEVSDAAPGSATD